MQRVSFGSVSEARDYADWCESNGVRLVRVEMGRDATTVITERAHVHDGFVSVGARDSGRVVLSDSVGVR